MSKLMREMASKREEGFTLIELIIVVVILIILAAIAVPIFLNQAEKAEKAAASTEVQNIGRAVLGGYGLNDLTVTLDNPAAVAGDADFGLVAPGSTIETEAGSVAVSPRDANGDLVTAVFVDEAAKSVCVSQTAGDVTYTFTDETPESVEGAACTTA